MRFLAAVHGVNSVCLKPADISEHCSDDKKNCEPHLAAPWSESRVKVLFAYPFF